MEVPSIIRLSKAGVHNTLPPVCRSTNLPMPTSRAPSAFGIDVPRGTCKPHQVCVAPCWTPRAFITYHLSGLSDEACPEATQYGNTLDSFVPCARRGSPAAVRVSRSARRLGPRFDERPAGPFSGRVSGAFQRCQAAGEDSGGVQQEGAGVGVRQQQRVPVLQHDLRTGGGRRAGVCAGHRDRGPGGRGTQRGAGEHGFFVEAFSGLRMEIAPGQRGGDRRRERAVWEEQEGVQSHPRRAGFGQRPGAGCAGQKQDAVHHAACWRRRAACRKMPMSPICGR